MSNIKKGMDISEIAAIVSEVLEANGITAVLSGSAAVSIYSENRYQSHDLDFVTLSSLKDIEKILVNLGFSNSKGRYFTHELTEFYLEFPPGPLAIAGEYIREWKQLQTKFGAIQLLTPTQCVMDRLATFYFWNDLQSLDQAVWVAQSAEIDLPFIAEWSEKEGETEKFQKFAKRLKI